MEDLITVLTSNSRLITIFVFSVGSFVFVFSSGRFGRHHFENWILSKPYVLNVLYFSFVGWMLYSIYKYIKGEEIEIIGNFFDGMSFFLFLYLTLVKLSNKFDSAHRLARQAVRQM